MCAYLSTFLIEPGRLGLIKVTIRNIFVRRFNKRLSFCALALVLASCSKEETPYTERSVGELYNEAFDLLEDGRYEAAATAFDEVDRQHPYSNWATKAQIMSGYAHYRSQKYDRAIPAFEAFTQLHPASPDVPYSLYMTGLCYYEQMGPSTRDQVDTLEALRVFKELTRRFPNVAYSKDAKLKINVLLDALAGKEMDIGRYYLHKNACQAAIPRFQAVVRDYDTTKHVEEALYRQVECYKSLGLMGQAKNVAAVLGHNYQGSGWYVEAYRLVGGERPAENTQFLGDKEIEQESWIDRLRNWNKGLPKKQNIPDAPQGSKESIESNYTSDQTLMESQIADDQ